MAVRRDGHGGPVKAVARSGNKHLDMGAVLCHFHEHPGNGASGEDAGDDGLHVQHRALPPGLRGASVGAVRPGVSEEGRSDEGLELVGSEHIPIQLVLRGQSAAPEHLPSLPQRVSRLGEMPPQGTGAGRNVGILGDHPGRAPVRSAIANGSTLSADPNGMATDGRPLGRPGGAVPVVQQQERQSVPLPSLQVRTLLR